MPSICHHHHLLCLPFPLTPLLPHTSHPTPLPPTPLPSSSPPHHHLSYSFSSNPHLTSHSSYPISPTPQGSREPLYMACVDKLGILKAQKLLPEKALAQKKEVKIVLYLTLFCLHDNCHVPLLYPDLF